MVTRDFEVATEAQAQCCGPFIAFSLWQPDEFSDKCTACGCEFRSLQACWRWQGCVLLSGRHHCRRCGNLLCSTCAKPQPCCGTRICHDCLDTVPSSTIKRLCTKKVAQKLLGSSPESDTSSPSLSASSTCGPTLEASGRRCSRSPAKRVCSAANRILSALRAKTALSTLDELAVQSTWRILHCDEEKQVNSLMSISSTISSPASQFDVMAAGAKCTLSCDRLHQLLALLRRRELPEFEEAMVVVAKVMQDLDALPNVVSVDVPKDGQFVIVGDLHGQMADFNYLLDVGGGPSEMMPFLFNGDFVDRGKFGLEVVLALCCLRLLNPRTVFFNRGNHECDRTNRHYGFYKEVTRKYDQGHILYDQIQQVFLRLPLVHVIGGGIAVMHAGLPPDKDVTLEEIQAIDRKRNVPGGNPITLSKEDRIFQSLLWSDPEDFSDGSDWKPSHRGAGVLFGEGLVARFLAKNGLQLLVRSHDVKTSGYATHHAGHTLTVFSASNYCRASKNDGCYLLVHPSLRVEFCEYSVLPGWLLQDGASKSTARKMLKRGYTLEIAENAQTAEQARDECLRLLRAMIFAKRSHLLHRFKEIDTDFKGTVTVMQWVHICKACLHEQIPWFTMRKYLVHHEDGKIPYHPFLERYQNGLVRLLMTKWSKKMVPLVAPYILNSARTNGGRVSFMSLCTALRQKLPGIKERMVYYLLVILCPGGRVNPSAIESVAAEAPPVLACVGDLWVMNNFHKAEWDEFHSKWLAAIISDPYSKIAGGLQPTAFAQVCMELCKQTGQAVRARWEAAAPELASKKTGCVEWLEMLTRVNDLNEEWARASQVLDILATTARVCVDLRYLFKSIDVDETGSLSLDEFQAAIEHLVGKRLTQDQVAQIFSLLDAAGDGVIARSEFISALEVTDTWCLDSGLQGTDSAG